MMNKLKAKLKKQGGFTLVEMLIVVAIIAILIAVSIPLVSNSLEKTREATDAANERAAKGEVMVSYLDGFINDTSTFAAGTVYAYDAKNGTLVTGAAPDNYGQCTTHKNKYLIVKYDETNSKVVMAWNTGTIPADVTAGTDLCMDKIIK